jgi:hypothetical protein
MGIHLGLMVIDLLVTATGLDKGMIFIVLSVELEKQPEIKPTHHPPISITNKTNIQVNALLESLAVRELIFFAHLS